MSQELGDDLDKIGLHNYASLIINGGWTTWDAVGEMTESDFDALGILLGDRRKLQREIARRLFWPDGSPLPTPDELIEFKLSRSGDEHDTDEHMVAESETPHSSHDMSSYRENVYSERNQGRDRDLSGGEHSTGQTSGSSGSIPTLQLDEMQDLSNSDRQQEINESLLSAHEGDGEEENTPMVVGDSVRSTSS